jgi:hypothetical protein
MHKPVLDPGSLDPKKYKCDGNPIKFSITGDYLDDSKSVVLEEKKAKVTWSRADIDKAEKKNLWFTASCTRRGRHPLFEGGDLSVTVTNGTGPTQQPTT